MGNLESLGLSSHTYSVLMRNGIDLIEMLVAMTDYDLALIPGLGQQGIQEVREKLRSYVFRNPLKGPKKQYIFVLQLSKRTYNALRRANINTLEQLVAISDEQLLAVRNFGECALAEVRQKLWDYLRDNPQLSLDSVADTDISQILPPQEPDVQHLPTGVRGLSAEDVLATVQCPHSLDFLHLSVRPRSALEREGIKIVERLVLMSDEDLLDIRNIGVGSLSEIREKLDTFLQEHPFSVEFNDLVTQFKSDDNRQLCAVPPQKLQQDDQLYQLVEEELLKQVNHLPLDQIPLSRLTFTKELEAMLREQGVESIGTLLKQSTHIFSLTELRSIQERVKKYLNWILHQPESALTEEINEQGVSPLYLMSLSEDSLDMIISSWFTDLNEREQFVISSRYGLQGEALTLEDIGLHLNLTRERVRQIQNRAEQKLKRPVTWRVIEPLQAWLKYSMVQADGLISIPQLTRILRASTSSIDVAPIGVARLVLALDGEVKWLSSARVWGLTQYPLEAVRGIQSQFYHLLKHVEVPVSLNQLLLDFKSTEFYERNKQNLDPAFIRACLLAHPKIKVSDGFCSLKKHSGKRSLIIRALRKLGKPAHYTVITEAVNRLLPQEAQVEPHNIHAQLQRLPDIFVWVESGTYGLVEWGIERSEFYVDIIAHVFRECGHPLTVLETLTKVCEVRDCKESTVLMLLTLNDRFCAFPGDVYGLVEWRNGEFPDTAYREKRLLMTLSEDEVLTRRKPRRNVSQALQDIDDLLSTTRSENRVAELPLFYGEDK